MNLLALFHSVDRSMQLIRHQEPFRVSPTDRGLREWYLELMLEVKQS